MKTRSKIIVLSLLTAITFVCYAQVETKRWWNVGTTMDTRRAVFCADIEVTPIEELLQNFQNTSEENTRLQICLRIIRSYQDKSAIAKAAMYCDSALTLATKLDDSLSIFRIHIANVYNMDIFGNPAGMLEQANLARVTMPRSVRETMEEFKLYSVIGDTYYSLVQYDQAERAYQKAKDIIEFLDSKQCKGYIDMSLGKTLQSNGRLDKAIEIFQESALIFESIRDTLTCCALYSHIAGAYSSLGIRDKQLEYLYRILELSKHLENPIHQAAIYRDLGLFYKAQNDSLRTAEFYNKSIEAYKKAPLAGTVKLGDIYNDMADFYLYLGDKVKALDYQRRSIQSYQTYPRPVTLAIYKMGYLHQFYENWDSAFYYYNEAYLKSFILHDSRLSSTCAKGLASYYRQIGDVNKAIYFAEISYTNARKIHWIEMVREVSGYLSNWYSEKHEYQKAYIYEITYRKLTDSLQVAENSREVARLSAQVEFTERETKMNLKIANQQRQIRTQGTLTILLVCVLALVIMIVVIVVHNSKQRERANIQLSEKKDELTATNEELITVNEELHKTYDELDHYKNDLELIVDEKTAELQQAFLRVQESDRFKAAFFANMSHEIRTPMNAILGFLQFVGNSDIAPWQREQMINLINANAKQLLILVDDIVDLSKIDSGLLIIRPEPFYIDELLDEIYESTEQLVRYSGKTKLTLVLEKKISGLQQSFLIDGKRVKQVLIHLLDNAIKFTDEGYIMFGCELLDDDHLQFFVEDTGIGISEEHRPEIFKRFWKRGEIYTQQYRGVGLGLSLCESLIGLMDSVFDVESTLGQGSVFRFTIKISS